jgi:hypothetical protein
VTDYPYRVRLPGGRNAHAARDVNGGPDRVTACDYYLPNESTNRWLDEDVRIGCRGCQRAIDKEQRP